MGILFNYLFFEVIVLTILFIQFKSGLRFDPTSPIDSTNNSSPINVAIDINIDPQIDEIG